MMLGGRILLSLRHLFSISLLLLRVTEYHQADAAIKGIIRQTQSNEIVVPRIAKNAKDGKKNGGFECDCGGFNNKKGKKQNKKCTDICQTCGRTGWAEIDPDIASSTTPREGRVSFEFNAEGLCGEGEGGRLTQAQQRDLEDGFLEYFNLVYADCTGCTEQITITDVVIADLDAFNCGNGDGRRRLGNRRCYFGFTCRGFCSPDWSFDRRELASDAIFTSRPPNRRSIQVGCGSQAESENILLLPLLNSKESLTVTAVTVTSETLTDCTSTSDACLNDVTCCEFQDSDCKCAPEATCGRTGWVPVGPSSELGLTSTTNGRVEFDFTADICEGPGGTLTQDQQRSLERIFLEYFNEIYSDCTGCPNIIITEVVIADFTCPTARRRLGNRRCYYGFTCQGYCSPNWSFDRRLLSMDDINAVAFDHRSLAEPPGCGTQQQSETELLLPLFIEEGFNVNTVSVTNEIFTDCTTGTDACDNQVVCCNSGNENCLCAPEATCGRTGWFEVAPTTELGLTNPTEGRVEFEFTADLCGEGVGGVLSQAQQTGLENGFFEYFNQVYSDCTGCPDIEITTVVIADLEGFVCPPEARERRRLGNRRCYYGFTCRGYCSPNWSFDRRMLSINNGNDNTTIFDHRSLSDPPGCGSQAESESTLLIQALGNNGITVTTASVTGETLADCVSGTDACDNQVVCCNSGNENCLCAPEATCGRTGWAEVGISSELGFSTNPVEGRVEFEFTSDIESSYTSSGILTQYERFDLEHAFYHYFNDIYNYCTECPNIDVSEVIIADFGPFSRRRLGVSKCYYTFYCEGYCACAWRPTARMLSVDKTMNVIENNKINNFDHRRLGYEGCVSQEASEEHFLLAEAMYAGLSVTSISVTSETPVYCSPSSDECVNGVACCKTYPSCKCAPAAICGREGWADIDVFGPVTDVRVRFEIDSAGLCGAESNGDLTSEQKKNLEEVLLDYFNFIYSYCTGCPKVKVHSVIVSDLSYFDCTTRRDRDLIIIDPTPFYYSASCYGILCPDTWVSSWSRRTSLANITDISSNRRLSSPSECDSQEDSEAKLLDMIDDHFPTTTSISIINEVALDCSPSSDDCTTEDACCGIGNCICELVSDKLCVQSGCDLLDTSNLNPCCDDTVSPMCSSQTGLTPCGCDNDNCCSCEYSEAPSPAPIPSGRFLSDMNSSKGGDEEGNARSLSGTAATACADSAGDIDGADNACCAFRKCGEFGACDAGAKCQH